MKGLNVLPTLQRTSRRDYWLENVTRTRTSLERNRLAEKRRCWRNYHTRTSWGSSRAFSMGRRTILCVSSWITRTEVTSGLSLRSGKDAYWERMLFLTGGGWEGVVHKWEQRVCYRRKIMTTPSNLTFSFDGSTFESM